MIRSLRARTRTGRATPILALLVGLSRPAAAQPPVATSVPSTSPDTAREAYDAGLRLFDAGRFAEAADAFGRSYENEHEARYLWNLALSEFRARRMVPALEHFRIYVSDPGATPKNIARANALIAELDEKVAHLTVTTDEGAAILVDERSRGAAPMPSAIEIDPDTAHTIVVRLGTREARRELAPPGPVFVNTSVTLPPPPPAIVESAPPPAPPVTVAAPRAEETRSSAPRLIVAGSLAAGAAIAAGVGVVFAINARANANDVATYHAEIPQGGCPGYAHCADLANAISANRTDMSVAYGLYAAGGALALGAVLSFVLMPTRTKKDAALEASVIPLVDPSGRQVGILGSF